MTAVPPDSLHVGMGIMRERALRIGAVVQVESAPGQGTRVCIELPSVVPAQTVAVTSEGPLAQAAQAAQVDIPHTATTP